MCDFEATGSSFEFIRQFHETGIKAEQYMHTNFYDSIVSE